MLTWIEWKTIGAFPTRTATRTSFLPSSRPMDTSIRDGGAFTARKRALTARKRTLTWPTRPRLQTGPASTWSTWTSATGRRRVPSATPRCGSSRCRSPRMRAVTGQGQVGLRRASDGSGGHWGCRNRVERDLPHVAVLHEQHVLDLRPVRSFFPGNMHRTVQADSQLHRRTVDTLNEHTELSQLGLGATQILADGGLPRPTTRNLRGPRNLALEQLPHRIQRRTTALERTGPATSPSLLFPPLFLLLILLILLFTYISRNENVVAKNTRAARRSLPRSMGTSTPAGGRSCEGEPPRFANNRVSYVQTIKTGVSSTILGNKRYVTRTFHVCSCMPRGSRASSLPGRMTYRKRTQSDLGNTSLTSPARHTRFRRGWAANSFATFSGGPSRTWA